MSEDRRTIAQTCFAAWKSKDFQMAAIITDIDVQKIFVDGDDVLTWFELRTSETPDPIPTANWSHIEDGKITAVRATFDARPLAALAR